MQDKITKVLAKLSADISRLDKVRPIVTHGKDGEDGVSPDPAAIAAQAAALIHAPKDGVDGVSPDPAAIAAQAAALIPRPRDGRDVEVSDVAAIVLAKIPTPKDGVSPDPTEVAALMPRAAAGKQGIQGPKGTKGIQGPKGNQGVSVTDVKLKNNEIFVSLDGKRKNIGKIKFPVVTMPFQGGGGSARVNPNLLPLSWRVINSVGDFGLQNETTIFLESNLTYIPGAPLVTSKVFSVGKYVSIFSTNPSIAHTWETTSSGDFFTGVDVGVFNFNGVNPLSPSGQIFNFTDTIPGVSLVAIFAAASIELVPGGLVAEKYGTFTDLRGLFIDFSSATGIASLGVNDGVTLGGTQLGLLSISQFALLSFSPTFVGLDLGSVVVSTAFEIENLALIGFTAGSIGIKGLPDSGNIAPGIRGTILGCDFIGPITPIDGIDPTDARLQFSNCDPVPNSTNDSFTHMTAARIVPVGAGNQGVFFPVAGGNWVSVLDSRFSSDSDGVVTYIGEVSVDINPRVTASVGKVGGGSDNISARINYDTGSGFPAVPPERTEVTTQSLDPTSVTPEDLVRINPGERFQFWAANLTGTSGITVSANAKLIVTNGF